MRNFFLGLVVAAALLPAADTPAAEMLRWMDAVAQRQLAARAEQIKTITTVAQARERQAFVRRKVLELIGGLPEDNPPLAPQITGVLEEPDYLIEKVYFTSLPGQYVTANLYRPRTPGKHPAVLFSLGHWDVGKPAAQQIAANLARKGFVVLAYDPIGQGERLQAFDSRTGSSLLGGSTEQHFALGAQSILAGQSFARYMIHDSQRALDYLISRPEVDAERIGATGCSGGGTQTTYIAALDPRIKVAAPACYMNSFQVLFTGAVGDSEQTIPGFLSAGLDQTDYVELFAPKPWLISSTEKDFFTPAGAKIVYEEARQWYRLFDAEDRVKWVVGPGGHGTPKEVREAIYGWMIRWLNNGQGDAAELPVHLRADPELRVTAEGQVARLPGAQDLYNYIASHRSPPRRDRGQVALLKEPVPVSVVSTVRQDGIETTELRLRATSGLELPATLRMPVGITNAPGVVLVQQTSPLDEVALRLARRGVVVLQCWPRGLPSDFNNAGRLSGEWMTSSRELLIGRDLVADRAFDIAAAALYLHQRPEVARGRVQAVASGIAGRWLLLAATQTDVLDWIWLDHTPYSSEALLQSPVIRDAYEGLSLVTGTQPGSSVPTRVLWTDPTDWMRNVIPDLGARFEYRAFDDPDDRFWRLLLTP